MYTSKLNVLETQKAIKLVKDTFERELAKALSLTRVSAPLFVKPETGLNDNLNGYERAVNFDILELKKEVEIVQSLAKWKRMALSKYADEEEAEMLRVPSVGEARTGECVAGIKKACEIITDRPVFAGIIGPYSLAGRLLDMTEIMILCYEEPEMVETVLEKATEFLCEYAKAFKEAGANGIVMAEPAAGLLSPGLIRDFSTPYVNKIREAVEDDEFLVIYHNCGNIEPLLTQMKEVDAKAYSFGNAINIEKALEVIPSDRMVIGNLDPVGVLKDGTPESIAKDTKALLERCSKYPNFVMSSGCDIPPATSLANLDAFCKAVQEF